VHGLIHRFFAHPGQRDRLIALITQGGAPPGCLSFVVAHDPGHRDAVWVTEVWTSEEAWRASLDLDWVKASIAEAQPLIASFEAPASTRPVVVLP
jgi:quinol monooxygenase YgiN